MEASDIGQGIGSPILNLVLFLLFAWIVIASVLIKGIRSSGKASYFLALFPYAIIGVLLIRAVTLEGAWNGILYFIKPRWDKILDPNVRFATVFFLLKIFVEFLTAIETILGLVCGCRAVFLFIGRWVW